MLLCLILHCIFPKNGECFVRLGTSSASAQRHRIVSAFVWSPHDTRALRILATFCCIYSVCGGGTFALIEGRSAVVVAAQMLFWMPTLKTLPTDCLAKALTWRMRPAFFLLGSQSYISNSFADDAAASASTFCSAILLLSKCILRCAVRCYFYFCPVCIFARCMCFLC